MTTLLVASNGGHLKQLHRLHLRLDGVSPPFVWVTFDTPQARSLLEGETVEYVPFIGGRDPRAVASNLPFARRILAEHGVKALVSTGSAIALPYFASARLRRVDCHYIESAARIEGPSMTGKLIGRLPGVKRYAQFRSWAGGRWTYRGAVFDAFGRGVAPSPPERIGRVVVTLGTYKGTPFTRIVRKLLEILPSDAEVLWQTGATDVAELGIEGAHYAIPERELSEAMAAADVVVTHAGVGSALAAFEVGKCPVLVPRHAAFGEVVDDHQAQIAAELAGRGLAVAVEVEDLGLDQLLEATQVRIETPDEVPPFELLGAGQSAA